MRNKERGIKEKRKEEVKMGKERIKKKVRKGKEKIE